MTISFRLLMTISFRLLMMISFRPSIINSFCKDDSTLTGYGDNYVYRMSQIHPHSSFFFLLQPSVSQDIVYITLPIPRLLVDLSGPSDRNVHTFVNIFCLQEKEVKILPFISNKITPKLIRYVRF